MILVTGGTGLVGSHLLLELVKTDHKVRAIHREDSTFDAVKNVFSYEHDDKKSRQLFEMIEWVEADLDDIPALTRAFSGIKKVYHCAALVSFNPAHATTLRKVNIEGSANIVNLCIDLKVEKLLYVSSVATMDLSIGEQQISENFTWHPEKDHTEYAITKHGAEIEVWRASQEGVVVVILNPGIILGPGFWNKGTGQIFKKIDRGLNYHFPKTTGFVGVKDVVRAAIQGMTTNVQNEQYIVVSENISFKKVLKETGQALGKKGPQKELKPWMVYIGWIYQSIASIFGGEKLINRTDNKSLFEHTYYSNEKIKKELKISFTPIKEVIEHTAKLYLRDKNKDTIQ